MIHSYFAVMFSLALPLGLLTGVGAQKDMYPFYMVYRGSVFNISDFELPLSILFLDNAMPHFLHAFIYLFSDCQFVMLKFWGGIFVSWGVFIGNANVTCS